MERLLHALDFLRPDTEIPTAAVIALFGDDSFLKRMAIEKLVQHFAGDDNDDVSPLVTYNGESCEWRDVADELSTASLFGGGTNIVLVDNADRFVTQHRPRLTDLAAATDLRGVLLLNVSSWLSTTLLAKQLNESGLAINCKPPETGQGRSSRVDTRRIAEWAAERASDVHDFKFEKGAALELVELVGTSFGMIDQQLAKLALFAGRGGQATTAMVIDHVGGWKTRTTWELLDAALSGQADEALRQLGHLLHSGDEPILLLGAFSWSLRRFANVARIVQQMERDGQRVQLRDALRQAGFRNFPRELQAAEKQLVQIGRPRATQIFQRLLEADQQLKGSHSSPDRARWVLERIILQLARQADPKRA